MTSTLPYFKHVKLGISEEMNRKNRRSMEDAHCYNLDFCGRDGDALIAVFDGHAGKAAAQWCGDNIPERFRLLLEQDGNSKRSIVELISKLFTDTDEELCDKKGIHSGCTAALAYTTLRNNIRRLYCANAGDARVVLSRKGKAVRLTYDHKGMDSGEIKRVIDSGGFIMNNRVNGVLAVTRSLGDMSMKDLVLSQPFTTETVMTLDDDLMIVACDGIWDTLSDQEAVNLIKDVQDPQEASDLLVKYALENGGVDNITCIVVRFVHKLDSPSPQFNDEADASFRTESTEVAAN
ncbi:hypothetical protein MP638_000758 [Amoeboaphelidium occidentale]|nr:hypothetical protein MP638_000758 [Amoeboaphelidium occidentale]